jgi:hypothetical protein
VAVIPAKAGGDGWESNPPRTPQQRPANGFEDRGEHQLSNIPSAGVMLVRERDAHAFDPERLRVAGQEADQEPEHPIDGRRAGDRRDERRLW